jgi:hypothetical protein
MMLPDDSVSHLDRMLEFRFGVDITDVRTLVSRDIGGTLRGLYGGGGSSPNVSCEAILLWSLSEI